MVEAAVAMVSRHSIADHSGLRRACVFAAAIAIFCVQILAAGAHSDDIGALHSEADCVACIVLAGDDNSAKDDAPTLPARVVSIKKITAPTVRLSERSAGSVRSRGPPRV